MGSRDTSPAYAHTSASRILLDRHPTRNEERAWKTPSKVNLVDACDLQVTCQTCITGGGRFRVFFTCSFERSFEYRARPRALELVSDHGRQRLQAPGGPPTDSQSVRRATRHVSAQLEPLFEA